MSADLSRRTLLRGLLGGSVVTLGLPVLEAHLGRGPLAHAATDTGLPRCFGLFAWANGNLPDRFRPTGSGDGDDWALSDQLAPLQRHKPKLTVVSDLAVAVANRIPHISGAGGFLTGMAPTGTDDSWTFEGPTIDQVIADHIAGSTRFRSLEFGADPGSGLSHLGPYQVLPAESDPYAFFQRVFGTGFTMPGTDPIIDPSWALRRSVLDAVLDDAARLSKRLGSADRARVEAHMDAVRDLELQLANLELSPPALEACAVPTTPDESYPALDGRPQLQAINQALCETAALALACDQTRVVSNFFSHPVSNVLHPGASDGHHNLTHDEPDPQDEVHDIVVRSLEAMATMLDALDAIEEIDGNTLLDRCAIVGSSDLSLGRTHAIDQFPFVLAGSAGGNLPTNRHVTPTSGTPTTHGLLSVARAVGADLASFGHEDGYTESGLTGLNV